MTRIRARAGVQREPARRWRLSTVLAVAFPVMAQAGLFSDQPDVVVCSVEDPVNLQPWDQLVFYVSARLEDGGILYKSLTSNPILVTISPAGRVDAENLADCDGKTVADLRAEGRAYDF
jgi:hypothetical protein